MNHLEHFGLSRDAFEVASDLGFFFESDVRAQARARLLRGLSQAKGLTLLYGEAGTGKTLLSRKILEDLDAVRFDPILMVLLPGTSGATDVLQRFARELGIQDVPSKRVPLLGQIYEALCSIRNAGRHAVLILDDVHLLSADAFEALGSLLALELESRRLLSMLLVGHSEIAERVEEEVALSQRVDIRVGLKPLSFEDLEGYLDRRLQAGGDSKALLSKTLVQTLFGWTRGRPRAINTVLDNAFFEAYLGGRRDLLASDIERAATDLGLHRPDPDVGLSSENSDGLVFEEPLFDMAPLAERGSARSTPARVSERDLMADLQASPIRRLEGDGSRATRGLADVEMDPVLATDLGWERGDEDVIDLGEPIDELRGFDE